MTRPHDLRGAFLRLAAFAFAGLMLVPALTYWFTGHAQSEWSDQLRAGFTRSVDEDAGLNAAGKADAYARIAAVDIETVCTGDDSALAQVRAELCAPTSDVGQFHFARILARALLLLGVGTLGLIGALALLAYSVPRLQTQAFRNGWRALRLIGAFEVAAQGALLVWLSFWLTAYFFEIYALKLILCVAIIAAAGVFTAIVAIFKRVELDNAVDGELIAPQDAPELWARVRQFSDALDTAPPARIVGGIDNNFFVTEAPLRVAGTTHTGRSLFVSLPLLRALERDEADAVLAHETAHFSARDTESGAALGPLLAAYAHYLHALHTNAVSRLAFYVLNLFRAAFEIALQRASRAREFAADARAAELVSASAISRALVRIAGYSHYRATVEGELYGHHARHAEPLRVAERVTQGLAAFTQSDAFRASMDDAEVPHPFDSHPPLRQRMQHVGTVIAPDEFAALVAASPAESWIGMIPGADAIEDRLWARYEEAFASQHEQALAYRYEPAGDAQRAIVLKYFPDVEIALKTGRTLRITIAGFGTDEALIGWDDVEALGHENGAFGTSDVLTVTHPEKRRPGGAKTTKVKLPIDATQRDPVKEALGRYWHRHQVMRNMQATAAIETAAAD